jgi:hypothetical protein
MSHRAQTAISSLLNTRNKSATYKEDFSMSRRNGISWLSSIGVAIAIVCLAGVLCAQTSSYSFTYYSNPSPATKDSTFHIVNPGSTVSKLNGNGFPTNGNICAMIYVFNNDEQVVECCGCLLTPDSQRTLSLNADLLSNPINPNLVTTDGVVEIVSAAPNSYIYNPYPTKQYTCDPTGDSTLVYKSFPSIVPVLELHNWATHIQVEPGPTYPETEEEFTYISGNFTTFSNTARFDCSAITSGAGHGTCSCGTGD